MTTDEQSPAAQWASAWAVYMHENRTLTARAEAAEQRAEAAEREVARLRALIADEAAELPVWPADAYQTPAERRAACAAAADVRSGEDVVPVRARERPTAWDDRLVSARGDRSRRWPGGGPARVVGDRCHRVKSPHALRVIP